MFLREQTPLGSLALTYTWVEEKIIVKLCLKRKDWSEAKTQTGLHLVNGPVISSDLVSLPLQWKLPRHLLLKCTYLHWIHAHHPEELVHIMFGNADVIYVYLQSQSTPSWASSDPPDSADSSDPTGLLDKTSSLSKWPVFVTSLSSPSEKQAFIVRVHSHPSLVQIQLCSKVWEFLYSPWEQLSSDESGKGSLLTGIWLETKGAQEGRIGGW